MRAQAAAYEPDASRDRRALRSRVNQMQRAIASIELSVDSLSPRDRVVVLHTALKDALAVLTERTRAA